MSGRRRHRSLLLAPSGDSRRRERMRKRGRGARGRRQRGERERGVALVMALSAVAILAVFVADMHENTGTAFAVASSQRERLQAEYSAKSAINLTRLLVGVEPQIRATVAPLYQMMVGRAPPQIPVWQMATEVMMPFCDLEQARGTGDAVGIGWRLPLRHRRLPAARKTQRPLGGAACGTWCRHSRKLRASEH